MEEGRSVWGSVNRGRGRKEEEKEGGEHSSSWIWRSIFQPSSRRRSLRCSFSMAATMMSAAPPFGGREESLGAKGEEADLKGRVDGGALRVLHVAVVLRVYVGEATIAEWFRKWVGEKGTKKKARVRAGQGGCACRSSRARKRSSAVATRAPRGDRRTTSRASPGPRPR